MGEVGAAGLGRDPGVSPLPASMEEESAEGSGGAGRRVGGDGMFSPPSSLKSGGIKVSLKKWSIWDKFYNLGTEMRMSKRGRFMFPYCEYSVSGLDPDRNYIMAMDISPVDTFRYRYNGCKWQINGKATAHVIGRLYFHPNGSVCGREWMAKPMSFAKLRLTNCPSAEEGHAILHSMHRYVPQLHIIVADGIVDQQDLNDRRVYAFIFQQTEFFAVTKYENKFIRQLKHFYNPYGTALRDVKACKQGGVTNRRARKQNDKINPFRDCEAKIQDSLKREESMKGLKDIVPLEDCSAKIEDAINNQGPRKTFPKIMPFENAVNVTQTFSFEAGIKLDELKPDEWLSLKYSEMLPGGQDPQSLQSESHGIRDTGIPFVSRTGKTNDLTKIKGWKNKFNLQSGSSDGKTSPPPASASCPAAIKNRSAFVSDLLDEYLEKEGKIIEQQGLLHEYENSEIEPPTLKPEGQRHVTFSPEATKPRSRKALNVEMSPVLEKHFRVTNKGIFIRDIRGAGTGKKVRRPGPKRGNSVGRRSKTSRQPGEALGKSEEAKLGNAHTTSSPKKPSSSPSLKIIQAEPGPRGGKGPVIPGNQTAATFNSGYTSAEEEEPQTLNRSGGDSEAQTPVEASSRLQLPPATNRSAGSKTVEIVSYCSWSQSRVRIIKLIAEHTMANRLPCTQQLGCYSVRLERGEVLGSGPTLAREAPPRRVVHARVTIRNAESVLEKPTVQTMVIEAMVGTSAFRTKLNHLISKVSKNSSEQVNMEPIRSPIQVVMNSEKAAPSSVYSPSETSCPTNQLSRLIAQDRDKVLPTTPTQRRELPLLVHTTGRETPKIPPSCIRSTAAATFQRIGTSCALVNSDIIPSSAIPVSSQSQADTSSTPSAPNLLGDSISPGLLTGSAEVLDRDGRRFCVAIPKALKLQPGDNLLLQPYTASDGRQLYKHSSGKLFQLVCAKAPEQTEQAGGPDHIPETSPLVDAHTPTISASTNCANGLHAATGAKTFHTSHSFPDGGSSEPPGVAEPLYKIVTLNPKPYPSPSSLPAWKSPDATPNSLDGFPHITSSLQATRLPNGAGESVPLTEQRANQQSRQPGTQAQVSRFPGLLKSGQSLGNWNQESEMEGSLVAAMAEERGGRTETRVERDPSPNNEMIAVKKDISEISAHRQLDPHGPEICTVTIKEEPVEEEEDAFAFGGSDFRTRSGFNFNVEAGSAEALDVLTHSENNSGDGFGNLIKGIARDSRNEPQLGLSPRESFYGSQGLKLPSKRKVRGVSEQGRARKNAMLHNLRERESRRMMEHRFKTLKKKLFDEQQTASKGAILDEAIDTISNLDKESKQLLQEKEELLGKQKVLLEKISLLSVEVGSTVTGNGIEAGEIIEDALSNGRDFPGQKSPEMRWFPEEPAGDHRTEFGGEGWCGGDPEFSLGADVKREDQGHKPDDIVMIKIEDDFGEKEDSGLDRNEGPKGFLVKRREELSEEEGCGGFTPTKQDSFGMPQLRKHSDYSLDLESANEFNVEVLDYNEPHEKWKARKNAILHTIRERESRRLMENRFKVLESVVFEEQKKAAKGAILNKAIDVISELGSEAGSLASQREELLNKQKELMERFIRLSATTPTGRASPLASASPLGCAPGSNPAGMSCVSGLPETPSAVRAIATRGSNDNNPHHNSSHSASASQPPELLFQGSPDKPRHVAPALAARVAPDASGPAERRDEAERAGLQLHTAGAIRHTSTHQPSALRDELSHCGFPGEQLRSAPTVKTSPVERDLFYPTAFDTSWLPTNGEMASFLSEELEGVGKDLEDEEEAEEGCPRVRLSAGELAALQPDGGLGEPGYGESAAESDPLGAERKKWERQEEAAFASVQGSSVGSSDWGSHSDFDLTAEDVNEIDVEILSHSDSEYIDMEMEEGEVEDGLPVSLAVSKLCAPPRWHFHNYSQAPMLQSHRHPTKRRTFPLELRRSRKNLLRHTMRERELRRLMQTRFNGLRELLFKYEKVSKRAILNEAINEIQALNEKAQKLAVEKKLLMKKHRALFKIISVLSGEKKCKDQQSRAAECEEVTKGVTRQTSSLLSTGKVNDEDSTLVPVAGTPFHLLLKRIAVSPRSEELAVEREALSNSHETRPQEPALPPAFPGSCSSGIPSIFSRHIENPGGWGQPERDPDKDLRTLQDWEQLRSIPHEPSNAERSTRGDIPGYRLTREEPGVRGASEGSELGTGAAPEPAAGPVGPRSCTVLSTVTQAGRKSSEAAGFGVRGRTQGLKATPGRDILRKLAKKVQEAGIKPWSWKSRRDEGEPGSEAAGEERCAYGSREQVEAEEALRQRNVSGSLLHHVSPERHPGLAETGFGMSPADVNTARGYLPFDPTLPAPR